jgi:hypothetical protein
VSTQTPGPAGARSAKIHFELGEARGETWVAGASAEGGRRCFGNGIFDAAVRGTAWLFYFQRRKGWIGSDARRFPAMRGTFGAPGGRRMAAPPAASTTWPCGCTRSGGGWVLYGNSVGGGLLRFGFDGSDFGFRRSLFCVRNCFAFGSGYHGNFRRLGGAESRGAFLRFGFPIGTAETFRGGEIPFAGIHGISGGLKITSQLESHHGIACFGEQGSELSRGILAGARSTNSCGDLLPVGHTVKAF